MVDELRDIQLADAEAIAEVENRAYRDLDPNLLIEGRLAQAGDRVAKGITLNSERGVVLPGPDGLLGVSLWRPCGDPVVTSHLHLLYIDPDTQRSGLGSRLLRVHWKKSLDTWPELSLFTLNCLKGSHWALSFYEKQGYSIAKPGDEDRVPGLSAYLDLPPSPGRPSRPPYFANLYQSAATVREKLSAEQ